MSQHPTPAEQRQAMLRQEAIERMVRRNEKALLRAALPQWRMDSVSMNENALLDTGRRWYLAACHKHGLGVVAILKEAGVALASWKPIKIALDRGLEELAWAMADLPARSEPLDPYGLHSKHIMTEVMRRGRVDVLEALFNKPLPYNYAVNPQGLDSAKKANWLLLCLARQRPSDILGEVGGVVDFLVDKGGDPNFFLAEGLSIPQRAPLAYQAAEKANLPVLRALVDAGAATDGPLRRELHLEARTLQTSLFEGIRSEFETRRKITQDQWDTMEYLAGLGVAPDLHEEGRPFAKLPFGVPEADKAKIEAITLHAKLNHTTPQSAAGRVQRRL